MFLSLIFIASVTAVETPGVRNGATLEDKLHRAALESNTSRIKELLQKGANPNANGQLLEQLATRGDSAIPAMKLLLTSGANRNVLDVRDSGKTLLHKAATSPNASGKMIELLISSGCKLESYSPWAGTPLHAAIMANNIDAAKALLNKGAAMKRAFVTAIDPWFGTKNSSLTLKGINSGFTPLMLAAGSMSDSAPMIRLLISRGADVKAPGSFDLTPLHMAAGAHNLATMRTLLDWGADVNARSASGATPLHLVVSGYFFESSEPTVQFLIQKGAECGAVTSTGETPLSIFRDRTKEIREKITAQIKRLDLFNNHPEAPELKRLLSRFERDASATESLLNPPQVLKTVEVAPHSSVSKNKPCF